MKILLLSVAILLLVSNPLDASMNSTEARTYDCAIVYQDSEWKGTSWLIGETSQLDLVGDENDNISSLKVTPGCTLTLFKDPNNEGRSAIFKDFTYDNMEKGWDIWKFNDQASSLSCTCQGDPCKDMGYKKFTSSKRIRTSQTKELRTDRWKCRQLINGTRENVDKADDWNGPGWYRFTGSAGTMLTTIRPDQYHCGFSLTGYLELGDSILPKRVGQEVDAKVCYSNSKSACLTWKSKIKIKKCDGYFIYKLPNARNCGWGYCGQQ